MQGCLSWATLASRYRLVKRFVPGGGSLPALVCHRAAPTGSELLTCDTGHDMRLADIRADRRAFLARVLGFDASESAGSAASKDQAATT